MKGSRITKLYIYYAAAAKEGPENGDPPIKKDLIFLLQTINIAEKGVKNAGQGGIFRKRLVGLYRLKIGGGGEFNV